jgi:tRNA-modifying protein YgfZ
MSAGSVANLEDRTVVHVSGADAGPFLQGLITNDMGLLEAQPAIFAGLLSPQGKILFDFIVVKASDGFELDVDKSAALDLINRLTMYRLRAKVAIAPAADPGHIFDIPDPRLPELGTRRPADYDAHRISLGVPESGKDYSLGDLFPHEAMFDQLHGVSLTKGCYVGQEIVSRMQHRGTARSRFLIADGESQLPPMGTPIVAGETPLGQMGSHADKQGLALIRLDRLAGAYAAHAPITAGGVPIRLTKPAYATFEVPSP